MTQTEIFLTIIGFILAYGGALVVAWINLNLKIKELEMKIIALENTHNKDITELKIIVERFMNAIDIVNSQNTSDHEKISNKIDYIKDIINEMKVGIAKNGITVEGLPKHFDYDR